MSSDYNMTIISSESPPVVLLNVLLDFCWLRESKRLRNMRDILFSWLLDAAPRNFRNRSGHRIFNHHLSLSLVFLFHVISSCSFFLSPPYSFLSHSLFLFRNALIKNIRSLFSYTITLFAIHSFLILLDKKWDNMKAILTHQEPLTSSVSFCLIIPHVRV